MVPSLSVFSVVLALAANCVNGESNGRKYGTQASSAGDFNLNNILGSSLGDLQSTMDGMIDKTIHASVFFTKSKCDGVPYTVDYSNFKTFVTDPSCQQDATSSRSSRDAYGITDMYADAVQRFGCNSFVMSSAVAGCGKSESLHTKFTEAVAFLADGQCYQLHNRDGGVKSSVRVSINDSKATWAHFRDSGCKLIDEIAEITGNSTKVGDGFCVNDMLYQVYDASSASSGLNTAKAPECTNKVKPPSSSDAHRVFSKPMMTIVLVSTMALFL